MTIRKMYQEMENQMVYFRNGWAHSTIVADVGNSTPVSIEITGGYAKYKGVPLRLTLKGWQDLYQEYQKGNNR